MAVPRGVSLVPHLRLQGTACQCRAATMPHGLHNLGLDNPGHYNDLSLNLSLLQLSQNFPDLHIDLPLQPLFYYKHLTTPIHSSATRPFHEQNEVYRNISRRVSNQVWWFIHVIRSMHVLTRASPCFSSSRYTWDVPQERSSSSANKNCTDTLNPRSTWLTPNVTKKRRPVRRQSTT